MAIDDGNPQDRDRLMATLGRAGAVLATAGAQFLSRGLDVSGQRGASAVAQATGTQTDRGPTSGWIDRLLENYRQYLGEMASTLPMIAQRIGKDLETPTGEQLLLRIDTSGQGWIQLAGVDSQNGRAPLSMFITSAANKRLTTAPIDLGQLAQLVSDYEHLRTLPKLLDQLKYDFRKRGVLTLASVPEELKRLAALIDDRHGLLDVLPQTLGENVLRRIIDDGLREQIENANPMPNEALLDPLMRAFAQAGIEISKCLSVIQRSHDWLLMDHERDLVFEIRMVKPWIEPGVREQAPTERPDRLRPWLEVYGPQRPRRFTVAVVEKERKSPEDLSRRLLLPVRVHDASQGFALWTIDKRLVQEHLDNLPSPMFKVWDIGTNKTPIVLFMVDYREGDLEGYVELGLGCFATPRRDALAVGMVLIGKIPVSTQFACDAGRQIWGYDKCVDKTLQIRYYDKKVTCCMAGASGQGRLEFTLPRRGDGNSTSVPVFSYTWKGKFWHRTVITRSGSGESVRSGGAGVELKAKLDPAELSENDQPGLGENLLYFGLLRKDTDKEGYRGLAIAPMLTGWTEHMSAQLEVPSVIVPREVD